MPSWITKGQKIQLVLEKKSLENKLEKLASEMLDFEILTIVERIDNIDDILSKAKVLEF